MRIFIVDGGGTHLAAMLVAYLFKRKLINYRTTKNSPHSAAYSAYKLPYANDGDQNMEKLQVKEPS